MRTKETIIIKKNSSKLIIDRKDIPDLVSELVEILSKEQEKDTHSQYIIDLTC